MIIKCYCSPSDHSLTYLCVHCFIIFTVRLLVLNSNQTSYIQAGQSLSMMTTEAIEFRYLCDLVGIGATVFWPSNGIVLSALFAISPFDWERKAKAQSLPQPSFTRLWTPFFLPYHIIPYITLPCSTKIYHITPHYTSPRYNISPHTILYLH